MEKLYTAQQVADITKQHINTVWKHLKEGKLKSYRVTRVYKISEKHLKEYMEGK